MSEKGKRLALWLQHLDKHPGVNKEYLTCTSAWRMVTCVLIGRNWDLGLASSVIQRHNQSRCVVSRSVSPQLNQEDNFALHFRLAGEGSP